MKIPPLQFSSWSQSLNTRHSFHASFGDKTNTKCGYVNRLLWCECAVECIILQRACCVTHYVDVRALHLWLTLPQQPSVASNVWRSNHDVSTSLPPGVTAFTVRSPLQLSTAAIWEWSTLRCRRVPGTQKLGHCVYAEALRRTKWVYRTRRYWGMQYHLTQN